MKIIKSFAAMLVCISSSALLHAQEIKTEIAKPIEAKAAATDAGKSSPQPAFKQQPQVAASATTDAPAVAETPSPLTRKEEAKPEAGDKPQVKLVSENDVITPGGEEGRKIMAGKSTQPAPEVNNQSTVDPKPAPQVKMPKPVNGQQQQ